MTKATDTEKLVENTSYTVEWTDGLTNKDIRFVGKKNGFLVFESHNKVNVVCRPTSIKTVSDS